MNSAVISSIKFIVVDIIGDFVYWPIWWYTAGLPDRLIWFEGQVKSIWKVLALGLWLKNFFVPMYGDRSILGRAISLVMRIVILFGWKLVWFIVWTALSLALLLIWILLPPAVIYMIYKQF